MNALRRVWTAVQVLNGSTEKSATDDYWYTTVGGATTSGVSVTPDSAMRVSAVLACVKVISETVAALPMVLYRQKEDGTKERAIDHPLYEVLHSRPNQKQTAMEFRELLQKSLCLRGNGYARIRPGLGGAYTGMQLLPIHPDRIEKVTRDEYGFIELYHVRTRDGVTTTPVPADEILHIRGTPKDEAFGMSVIEEARDAVGLSAAAEEYAGRFFGNNARPGGLLVHPGRLSKEAKEKLRQSWTQMFGGPRNANKVGVLEEGLKWEQLGMKHDEAQFLELREYQVTDIARLFRVPPHKIADLKRATFSNIEHMSIEFVVDCIMPWVTRWEQAVSRALLVEGEGLYCEVLLDALLRGDTKSRYEAYASGINAGWLTRNEARRMENRNPLPGLDEPLSPLNMKNGSVEKKDDRGAALVLAAVRNDVASRIAAAEQRAYSQHSSLAARDVEAYRSWVSDFVHTTHAKYVENATATLAALPGGSLPADAVQRILATAKEELSTASKVLLSAEVTTMRTAQIAAILDPNPSDSDDSLA